MKSFKFSDQEIELLITMYEDELSDVMEYSDRLRETLAKLRNDASAKEVATLPKEGKKRGRKPGTKVAKTTGKKRGRKPKAAQGPEETPAQAAAPKAIAEKKSRKNPLTKGKKRGPKPGKARKAKPIAIAEQPVEPVI